MRVISEALFAIATSLLVLYGLALAVADTGAHYSDFDRALMRELIHNHTSTLN